MTLRSEKPDYHLQLDELAELLMSSRRQTVAKEVAELQPAKELVEVQVENSNIQNSWRWM